LCGGGRYKDEREEKSTHRVILRWDCDVVSVLVHGKLLLHPSEKLVTAKLAKNGREGR
jgi:hypothetical protein